MKKLGHNLYFLSDFLENENIGITISQTRDNLETKSRPTTVLDP